MIERASDAENCLPVHVHMLRHSTGYALGRGMDTRRLQRYLRHA